LRRCPRNDNPAGLGINYAIDLHQVTYVAQTTNAVNINGVNFRTDNASITTAVNYDPNMIGNFPFSQIDNVYQNGITPFQSIGQALNPSIDNQTMERKFATQYGITAAQPYGPEFDSRAALGTQGVPTKLANTNYGGAFMFKYFDAQGLGPNADGFIYGGGLVSIQNSIPTVGGAMSASMVMLVQDPGLTGGLVQDEIWEPAAIVTNVIDHFIVGLQFGVSGPTFTSGAAPPSGSCGIGSLYTNSAATSAATVLYRCWPANTWTAVP